MKSKISFLSLFFLLCSCIVGFSQGSYPQRPLFGTAPNTNKTGSILTYGYYSLADTANVADTVSADTVAIIPSDYNKIYILTLTDRCVLAIKNVGTSWTGSTIKVIIENSTNSGSLHWVKFLGYSYLSTQWIMTGGQSTTVYPGSGKRSILTFICDGTAWVQSCPVASQ